MPSRRLRSVPRKNDFSYPHLTLIRLLRRIDLVCANPFEKRAKKPLAKPSFERGTYEQVRIEVVIALKDFQCLYSRELSDELRVTSVAF